jgi:hypothetical protein
MSADGAVRDFGRLQGVTQGASPQRAVTEEQRRSRAKDPPLRICSLNTRAASEKSKVPNAAAGINRVASGQKDGAKMFFQPRMQKAQILSWIAECAEYADGTFTTRNVHPPQ